MTRRKFCQHPTRHEKSPRIPIGRSPVSLRLLKYILGQYNLEEAKNNVLCPRCHSFETKSMKEDETLEIEGNRDSSDECSNDGEEKVGRPDDGDDCNGNDDYDDGDGSGDDDGSNDSHDDVSYDLSCQQEEALKKLSDVFHFLNIGSIHDK